MADPATVASQLLAFQASPVRYRQRLTHGHEPFPGGIHVFRIAQGKFPNGILRDLSAEERRRLREAARFFVRQVCFWERATHYQVLCVEPDARLKAIRENYQGLIALIHPDRQVDGEESWPDDFARRANAAWAVLSDETARQAYDASLGKVAGTQSAIEWTAAPAVETELEPEDAPARHTPRRSRRRVRLAVEGIALAVAALFYASMWWAAEYPERFATLQGATPLERSWQWMWKADSSITLPSFLGVSHARTSPQPVPGPAEPAARSSSNATAVAREPSPDVVLERPAMPASAKKPAATRDAKPASPAPVRQAQAEPARPREAVGQGAAASPGSDLAAHLPDLEVLVTRMVAYYEEGDLDRFLGLYHGDSLGIVEAFRVRNDFDDFFRATTVRRLSLRRIDWTPSAEGFRGTGQATVIAQYADDRGRVERPAAVQIDVRMIGGRPRISRLALFPHE